MKKKNIGIYFLLACLLALLIAVLVKVYKCQEKYAVDPNTWYLVIPLGPLVWNRLTNGFPFVDGKFTAPIYAGTHTIDLGDVSKDSGTWSLDGTDMGTWSKQDSSQYGSVSYLLYFGANDPTYMLVTSVAYDNMIKFAKLNMLGLVKDLCS